MKKVVVITGGAGGMGLATAKILGQQYHIVITDILSDRLDAAIGILKTLDISCDPLVCDVANRESVAALAKHAASLGEVTALVHTAGLSPQMADAQTILRVNALGTVNIAEEFLAIAAEGFALVNVASMAAHMFPNFLLPTRAFPLATSNPAGFLKKTVRRTALMPNAFYRKGMAYGISKNFVVWFSKHSAAKFGEKGARILSVSPGTFDTDMGRLEEKSGSMALLKKAALKRPGRPEEIAEVLAFFASDKASYVTGVDILCDGGVIASKSTSQA